MKKLLIVLLALAALFIVVSCSSSDPKDYIAEVKCAGATYYVKRPANLKKDDGTTYQLYSDKKCEKAVADSCIYFSKEPSSYKMTLEVGEKEYYGKYSVNYSQLKRNDIEQSVLLSKGTYVFTEEEYTIVLNVVDDWTVKMSISV